MSGTEKPAYADALRGILRGIRVNEDVIDQVIENYKSNPQGFETNPWNLYNWLTALQIRPDGAKAATERFWAIVSNTPIGGFGQTSPVVQTPFGMMPNMTNPWQDQNQMMMNPFMMAQMMASQSPSKEDRRQKMLEFMEEMQIIKAMNQPQQQFPFPMMGGGGMVMEPAIGKDGRAVLDQNNQPVYTFRTSPSEKKGDSMLGGLLTDLLKTERDRGTGLETKILDMMISKSDQDAVDLKRRVQYLEGRTASETFMEDYSKMRKTFPEIFGSGMSGNPEVDKMKIDLEKWKAQTQLENLKEGRKMDFEWKKWLEEKKLEHEIAQQSRQQIRELGATLREGIQSIAAPMAKAAATGMIEGQGMSFDARPQNPQGNAQTSIDVSRMSDDELNATIHKATQANDEIRRAYEVLAMEKENRRQRAIHMAEAQQAQESSQSDMYPSSEYSPPSAHTEEEEFDPFDIGPEYTGD